MNENKIDKFRLDSIGENSSIGFILQLDLQYLDELHEKHNVYPVAPEKLEISHNIFSNYCSSIANKYSIKIGAVNKLVPNLSNKSKYILYYRNRQLYLSLGMKFVSVHRILKFKQSDCLKKSINFNIEKRKHARNSFEKAKFCFDYLEDSMVFDPVNKKVIGKMKVEVKG